MVAGPSVSAHGFDVNPVISISMITAPPALWNSLLSCTNMFSNSSFASQNLGAITTVRVCDLCVDPVEGLFYRCKLCEFDVHPLCTQLPEHVRHVMHKDHPLRLQRSVPAPCAEETTTTSTPRSAKRPAPPPSAPPFFDASHRHGA
ncbi:hypothetical protein PTKIN_Ptkin06aG0017600 [Pterospermum kingtungense]